MEAGDAEAGCSGRLRRADARCRWRGRGASSALVGVRQARQRRRRRNSGFERRGWRRLLRRASCGGALRCGGRRQRSWRCSHCRNIRPHSSNVAGPAGSCRRRRAGRGCCMTSGHVSERVRTRKRQGQRRRARRVGRRPPRRTRRPVRRRQHHGARSGALHSVRQRPPGVAARRAPICVLRARPKDVEHSSSQGCAVPAHTDGVRTSLSCVPHGT